MEDTSENSMPNIFINAGASDLGLAIIKRLHAQGHRVHATASGPSDAPQVRAAGGLPVYLDAERKGELVSALKMAETAVVIHLETQLANGLPFRAADWHPEHIISSTRALVEAAQETGVAYLVYVSTAFLYAPADHPVSEDAPLIDAEDSALIHALREAESLVMQAPIASCILRAGYTYGPDSPETQFLAEALRSGRPFAAGDKPANWVHSDDLAAAVALAATQQPENALFNVVDEDHTSPRDFLHHFAEAMGLQRPDGIFGFVGRALQNKHAAMLNRLSAQASSAKIREALGWEPEYPHQDKGIERTLLAWRARPTFETSG